MTLYTIQLTLTALTIVSIPVLLRYIRPDNAGQHYRRYAWCRVAFFIILAIINMVCYFIYDMASFAYLAAICALTIPFGWPKTNTH
jgi:hypothetical protein